MINASNAFKRLLNEGKRDYLEYVDITLANGSVLSLTNKDLWGGGLTFEDAVSSDSSFDIGAAIINKCTIVINNINEDFSEYDFTGASVVAYVGLKLPDGTTERIRKGTYAVDDAKYNGSIITLSCLDNMRKFDKLYSESPLIYPATLRQIIRDACSKCDVTLRVDTFPHNDHVVNKRPADEALTYRSVIAWAAQIAGCFCRCDVYGRLEIKWYDQEALEAANLDGGIFDNSTGQHYTTGDNADGGSFNPWNIGYEFDGGTFVELKTVNIVSANYSMDISTDDVVITGVRVIEKTKEDEKDAIVTYQSGTDGYVVSIENNGLVQGGAGQQIVEWLGQQLIGFRFRRANVSHPSDPTMEAGDVGFLSDRKGNTYRIVVSSTRFTTGGAQNTVSSAENPARNSAARFSAETKNYVEMRENAKQEISSYDKTVQEMTKLISQGFGMYFTPAPQEDGGNHWFLHNKPTIAESDYIWQMTDTGLMVSLDGGLSWAVDRNGNALYNVITTRGLNADWINAGAFEIKRDGMTMVLMDKDTGQVILRPDVFELSSGKTMADIADEQVNDFISAVYDPQIANLQSQIDGQIETWYYDHEPTLYNTPASSWNTEALRARHEGDLFYWKSKGYSYRFFKDGGTWKWQLITDSDITKALANAAKAQDTADHKRRVFITTPYTPYDAGDLWFGGSGSDIMTCVTSRASGSYVSTDWQKRNKYIDQAAANTAATSAAEASWSAKTNVDIFNKLTKNGTVQGISTDSAGNIYINATYINSGAMSADHIRGGTLALGGANNVNGAMNIYNSSGTRVGYWNNTGINAIAGTIGGFAISSTQILGSNASDKDQIIALQIPRSEMNWALAIGRRTGTGDGQIWDPDTGQWVWPSYTYSSCAFRVSKAGELVATSASIKGKIIANDVIFNKISAKDSSSGKYFRGSSNDIVVNGVAHHFVHGIYVGTSATGSPNAPFEI